MTIPSVVEDRPRAAERSACTAGGRSVAATAALAAALIVLVSASCRVGQILPGPARDQAMPVLSIHLQEGFRDDRVIVSVGGRVVFDQAVTTHLMHGFARSFETPVPRGPIDVEVRVGSNGFANRITVDVLDQTYLGVAIREGVIEFRVLDRPPAYG
jgi:hypothetical protein